MVQNILHATDLSEEHYHISERAKDLANQLGAKLHLIHVIELPASIQLAQSLGFAELASPSTEDAWSVLKILAESLSIPEKQLFVSIGSVSDQIVEKCHEINCDLLVLGSHSPQNFSALPGSNVHSSLRHAPCDVLILKP